MDGRARAVAALLSGSRLSASQRRRTDAVVLTVLAVAWAAVGVVLPSTKATPALAYWATAIGASLFAVGALAVAERTRALTLGASCGALVLWVLAMPIYPTHAVGVMALLYCLITLYDDVLAWVLAFISSAVVTLLLAAQDPHLVFGSDHRHLVETPGSLAGHLLMFVLAASASGIVWMAVVRARAVERDAQVAEDAVRRLVPALRDVHDRRLFTLGDLAQRARAHAEELQVRGRHLLDHVEDAVVEVAVDGSVLYANPAAARLWGHPAETLRGRDAGGLLLVPWTTLREAAGTATPARTTAVHVDGSMVPVQVVVTRLGDDEQEAVYVVTALNLTDRLAAQEALLERERLATQRRYALELNDTVVQGLTIVAYAHEVEAYDEALTTARDTLAQAREMVATLLDDGQAALEGGQLRRRTPATPRADDGSVTGPPLVENERLF